MNLFTDGTIAASKAECEAAIAAIDASADEAAKRTASKDLVQAALDAEVKLSGFTVEEVAVGEDTGKVVVVFPTDSADPNIPNFFAAAAAQIVETHGGTLDGGNLYRVCQDAIKWVGVATAWDATDPEIVTAREGGHLARIAAAL